METQTFPVRTPLEATHRDLRFCRSMLSMRESGDAIVGSTAKSRECRARIATRIVGLEERLKG